MSWGCDNKSMGSGEGNFGPILIWKWLTIPKKCSSKVWAISMLPIARFRVWVEVPQHIWWRFHSIYGGVQSHFHVKPNFGLVKLGCVAVELGLWQYFGALTILTETLLLLLLSFKYFDKFIVMSDSYQGEAFICHREVVFQQWPKIRVLIHFKAKDLKIESFCKIGFVWCYRKHLNAP